MAQLMNVGLDLSISMQLILFKTELKNKNKNKTLQKLYLMQCTDYCLKDNEIRIPVQIYLTVLQANNIESDLFCWMTGYRMWSVVSCVKGLSELL